MKGERLTVNGKRLRVLFRRIEPNLISFFQDFADGFVFGFSPMFDLQQFSIHKEAVPEALEKMPYEAFRAIEKTKFNPVPVLKVKEGSEEERQS